MKKIVFILCVITLFSTGNLVLAQDTTPIINNVMPSEVNWGNYITIEGNNFEESSFNNKFFFDNYEINTNEWSNSEIRIRIGEGLGGYHNQIVDDRKIENISVLIYYTGGDHAEWLQADKSVSISIKPVIEFVWQIPKKTSLQSGDLMYIQGPLIKPGEDKIYIDNQEANWDLSNTSSIPQNAMNKPDYYGQGFFKLPNNLTSANSIKIVTSDGVESDISLLSKFGHSLVPTCTADDWSCSDWNSCSSNNNQTRTCTKISNCEGGVASPTTSQSCAYTPACTAYDWSCGDWGSCSSNGIKTRECNKISNCNGGTQSPAISQSCTYTPACSADTWQCGNWSACSPQGIQTRSCNKTFDCSYAETAAPAVSQYCEAPQQNYQTPSTNSDIVANQGTIIKSTVKLICPVSETMASQGSGTVIDSGGLILTNKHVIDGSSGCWVGFIDDYGDEPYFGDRQIADIYKVSSDADIAILKLRNPNNKKLISVNIYQNDSNNIQLGETLTTYGYPAKFGTKITYTSGDFSGVDGNYLKTTAIIEHGNSGGGAYLKNGTFVGIPSAVVKGSLNSMGYLLSVNKINSWLNNSIVYNYNSNNNNYSRVSSILENVDLNTLDSFDLFIAGDDQNIKTESTDKPITEQKNSPATKTNNSLSTRLKGKILLQVQAHGEAYYINPKDEKMYYMANGNEAYRIMRYLGVGITNADLDKVINDKTFAKKHSGKIFLQVQAHGEAYYIDFDGTAHYLKDGTAAYAIMRDLGLGITNSDLGKISEGSL